MEKFYTVTKESPVYEQYYNAEKFKFTIGRLFTDFAQKHGIVTTRFRPNCERLMIDPTTEDWDKFGDQMRTKPEGSFKLKSPLNIEWVKLCKDNGLHTVTSPFLPMVFHTYGKSWFRLFDVGGILYCTFESQSKFETPIGFVEMKASDFYKIMEDNSVELN